MHFTASLIATQRMQAKDRFATKLTCVAEAIAYITLHIYARIERDDEWLLPHRAIRFIAGITCLFVENQIAAFQLRTSFIYVYLSFDNDVRSL